MPPAQQPALPRTQLSIPTIAMFAKVFTLALAGFATLALAAPAPNGNGSGGLTTGSPLCCQKVENSSDPFTVSLVKEVLGIDVSGLNIPIGVGCSTIGVASAVTW
jgi:hypothetical protein